MADNVRFAIVGLGMGMGRARMCAESPGAELVAVCDTSEERGTAAKEELGVEWIREYRELLERSDLDVIGIWSPSGMHASMAAEALEAGKHVCSTKPMDIKTSACDRAIELADRNNLILAIDYESRYKPVNHRIRNALQSGAIGNVVLADLTMKWYRAQSYYDSGYPEGWRSRMATERGSMANQAVHYIDLMQWWMGPILKIVGKRGTFGHTIETEDVGLALLEFSSGAVGSIVTTTCSFPDLGTQLEFTGRNGTLTWQNQGLSRFVAAGAATSDQSKKRSYDSTFEVNTEPMDLDIEKFDSPDDLPENVFLDVIGALRNGTEVQCDGREARKSVAIFEAVYGSSDSGRWIELS